MLKALWIIWLAIIWFIALVFHSMIFANYGFEGIAILLALFWLIYLAGLWFEQTRITDTAWAMLLGYAIGCIRLLDLIPNQQQYAQWLKHLPKSILGGAALLFILLFIGVLPLLAQKVIESHKAKNRVLGRDI
jgi:hypothetical protein